MSQDTKKKYNPFLHDGHRPVTRRDFIAQGLIGSLGMVMAPTVLSAILKSSYAMGAECEAGGGMNGLGGVLIIDHAGGAGLTASALPRAMGDQFLTDAAYRTLGMPNDRNPRNNPGLMDTSWGVHLHNQLGFFRGLNTGANAAAKALTTGFSVLADLGDDTGNNRTNPSAALALVGALGDADRKLSSVIGTNATESGGNSAAAVSSPLYRAVRVNRPEDAAGLISLGVLRERLNNNPAIAAKVVAAMKKMTSRQLASFSNQEIPEQAKALVDCGYLKATDLAGGGALSPDPRTNALVFGANGFNMNDSVERQAGTLTYLLAQGLVGVATLTLGSRDYHDGTRATGERLDEEAGRITRKAFDLVHRMINEQGARARPFMVIHITDGSVSTNQSVDNNAQGLFTWNSDGGDRSGALVFAYNPAGKLKQMKNQLGYAVASNGGVDKRNSGKFAGNAAALGEVFVANWLSMNGRSLAEMGKLPTRVMSDAEIEQVIALSKT